MNYHIIPVTAFAQNCSVIWCESTREAALVDPGGDADLIKETLEQRQLKPSRILLTHGHLDHVGAAVELAAFWQIPIVGPQKRDAFWLEEGESVQVGLTTLEVLHCPGHSPGHVVFFDRPGRLLISGDVIFNGGVGRTDFPQGDHQQLINAIRTKLLPLGDDVTFLPGHGPISTLGHERISNPFLQ